MRLRYDDYCVIIRQIPILCMSIQLELFQASLDADAIETVQASNEMGSAPSQVTICPGLCQVCPNSCISTVD
jgi:hypothetical protein